MIKVNVTRKGHFVQAEGGNFVELETGEQSLNDVVAKSLIKRNFAIAVIEEPKTKAKPKK